MEKIKLFLESRKGKEMLTVTIIILVGLSSFGLGRLSVQNISSGIKISIPSNDETGEKFIPIESQEASAILSLKSLTNGNTYPENQNTAGKNFFASKRGKKYYPVGCSAGKNLKLENRIYFGTKEQAEKAGYELSSSCR